MLYSKYLLEKIKFKSAPIDPSLGSGPSNSKLSNYGFETKLKSHKNELDACFVSACSAHHCSQFNEPGSKNYKRNDPQDKISVCRQVKRIN